MITMPTKNQPQEKRVAMIITRSLDDESYISRVRTLRAIHTAIDSSFGADVFRLRNILETRKVSDLLYAAWILLVNLLKFSPLPLQCAFYASRSDINRIASTISRTGYEKVYLDSVRCLVLLRALTRDRKTRQLVADFDDLLSRRMRIVAANRMPLSLGFAQKYFPSMLRRAIEGPLAQLINRHEAATLPRAESEIANFVNSIVLVSEAERKILSRQLPSQTPASIYAIPPPARAVTDSPGVQAPLRFVFIGSDRQIHNRLSIELLLQMWRQLEPQTPLHIYGKQQRTAPVRNIVWHGFVDDISNVYSEGSILLLPALLSGGIKTKVIEAWAHGRPVLGNAAAFEGLQIPEYPLRLPEADWVPLLLAPEEHLPVFQQASRLGHHFINTDLSPARYRSLWCTAITATGADQRHPRATSEDDRVALLIRNPDCSAHPPSPQ
jgi:glycosyltransferase involved in cell wall biosynthesis